MKDVKSMMGHVRAVYGRWPSIRIEKRHPHDDANLEEFILVGSLNFKGIQVTANVVITDLADQQQIRRALSNITAGLFRECGQIALAAAAQTGGKQ